MIIGKVVGNVVATIKAAGSGLDGYKLLIVKPIYSIKKDADLFVAIDLVGAGIGEDVIVLTGSQVQKALKNDIAADAAITGIVQAIHIPEK
jgi:ethanolamine utilization protein EutN